LLVFAPGKSLFISLLLGSVAGAAVVIAGIWYISGQRFYFYQKTVLVLGVMLATAVVFTVAVGVFGLLLILWKGSMFPFLNSAANMAVNLLFPVALQMGRLLGISEDKIKGSFIEVNNHLITLQNVRADAREILVLAPHCLQYNGCPFKVTRNIENCRQCGNCRIGDFLKIRNEFNVHVAVVTGGTMARKYIRELRPKAVIAIACERDLTSGILDSYPLPVYGILNDRPCGPCQDTQVKTDLVNSAILNFIERR